MKKFIISSVIAIALYAGFVAWTYRSSKIFNPTLLPNQTLTIAESQNPAFALIYIAEDQGYFREENLTVNYNKFIQGRDALQNVLDGKADLATVFETPVVHKILEGQDIAIFTSLQSSTENSGILAKVASGILKPSDLKGKKIGLSTGTGTEFALSQFLLFNNIDSALVTPVNLPLDKFRESLLNNEVDAVSAPEPRLTALQYELKDTVVTFPVPGYSGFSVVAGLKTLPKEKGTAIQKFINALVRAEYFIQNNEAKSKDIVVNRLKGIHSEQSIKESWRKFDFGLKIDNIMLTILAQEASWAKDQHKYRTTVSNFNDYFVPEYLERIKPTSVTIFH
jgi:NitT/TauT family transport system substrate-binding protein